MVNAEWCVVYWQLIPMTDIKEMTPEFQKLNKTDNCIVIYLKNDARIAVTSQVLLVLLSFINFHWQ